MKKHFPLRTTTSSLTETTVQRLEHAMAWILARTADSARAITLWALVTASPVRLPHSTRTPFGNSFVRKIMFGLFLLPAFSVHRFSPEFTTF